MIHGQRKSCIDTGCVRAFVCVMQLSADNILKEFAEWQLGERRTTSSTPAAAAQSRACLDANHKRRARRHIATLYSPLPSPLILDYLAVDDNVQ